MDNNDHDSKQTDSKEAVIIEESPEISDNEQPDLTPNPIRANGRRVPESIPAFQQATKVDEVDPAKAKEIPKSVPTQYELTQLVKYWQGQILEHTWAHFMCQQRGDFNCYTLDGIRRVAKVIGKRAVNQAIEEAREEFRAKINDTRRWRKFEELLESCRVDMGEQ